MSNKREKKQKKKRTAAILAAVSVTVVVIAAAVLLIVLRVDTVSVKGNFYSDRETVIRAVLPDENDTRLYRVLWKSLFGTGSESAFESCKLRLTGLQSAEITIRETSAVSAVRTASGIIFLNENGVVLGEGAGNADLLPSIERLTIRSVTELEKLSVEEESGLDGALEVIRYLKKFELRPETVRVSGETFEAVFGDVTVRFGTTAHLQEKATELSNQFPHYKGLRGIMHLESGFEPGENRRFYFEVLP